MIRRHGSLLAVVLALSLLAALQACGGGGSTGPSGGGGGGGGGSTNPQPGEAATITILPSGTTPKTVTVPVGSRVNFDNQSGNNIEISSDPHPLHTECPPLNIGGQRAGQVGQTGALTVARTCRYHDHGRPDDERWQGSIVIQ